MTGRLAWTLPALLSVLVLSGCGDDEPSPEPSRTSTVDAAGDVDRYCEITADLDKAGSEVFAELEADDNATDEDYAAAEAAFVRDHADDFAELVAVAPESLRPDLQVLLEAQAERAAGGEQEEATPQQRQAEKRIRAFESQNC